MEESQSVDINDVALESIVQIDAPGSAPAAEPAYTPEPLPTNNETIPAEPHTPADSATEQVAEQQPEPELEAEATPGTGEMDDPIQIETEAEPGAQVESQPDDYNQEEQTEIFNEHLGLYTDGKIQSVEDINNMAKELETLKSQPQQPEFTSESAKKLFEFAKGSANPLSMGKNYLHAVSLDLESLSDKQKMFEAYVLDEQNSDLSREQALEIFNEDYEDNYADAEDSVTGKRKVTLAVRSAEEQIKSMQTEAMEAQTKDGKTSDQPSPEVVEEINRNIDSSLAQTESINIHTGDDIEFNFDVSTAEDRDLYTQASKDPVHWLQDKISAFQNDATGKFDYDGYNAFIGSLVFSGRIAEGMFKHGQNNGKKAMVDTLQNPSKPGTQPSTMPTADNRPVSDRIWDKLEEKMKTF